MITIPSSFYNAEERCGYYVSAKMKQVWAVEMDLLSELLSVCKKNNLPCFVDAGTLLGTIRHKGFIPWDDDIDVCLFRKDYDKLVEIAEDEFRDPYKFQCYYMEENYYHGHAQLRNINTTCILDAERKLSIKFNQGIFIDIFVLDYVPQSMDKLLKLRKKIRRYQTIIFQKAIPDWPHRTILGKCKGLLARSCPGDYRYYARKVDQALRENPKTEYVAPLAFKFDTEKRIRLAELYKETIWLPFEFMEVPVPIGYDTYLKNRFGNYMEPVQIPNSHGGAFFDVDHPAEYYLNEKE